MNELITPAAAEGLILDGLPVLGTIPVPLGEAARHVLATPLAADRPLPPHDRVMMDGIACRVAEAIAGGGELTIAGLHPAGAAEPGALPAGHCWEIMTGAALPPDCDCVVPYEEIEKMPPKVLIRNTAALSAGQNIHSLGSDFAPGAELVPAGRRLGPRELAVAATVGATTITVRRPPRVAIITTGDELVPPDQAPLPHQVRQSNAPSLAGALAAWGPAVVRARHVPDEEAALGDAIDGALADCDLLLLCGGISKGQRDYVRPVLETRLGPPALHGVAQRPGKPLAFWRGPVPVFALPGNPISVLVTFHRFVLPALAAMHGQAWSRRTVTLAEDFSFRPPVAYHLPVTLTADGRAVPAPLANSGDFASAIPSDGFIELPADQDEFPAGFAAPYLAWL
ncbi:MAG: molybdopterin molybdotransferase MoeA [Akkermansiaceae bacterium]|nr:molybdopterin molybdotransferase MoeA [Akkermansiaceae bacterium]